MNPGTRSSLRDMSHVKYVSLEIDEVVYDVYSRSRDSLC